MTHPFIFHGQSKDWFRVTNDTLTLKLAIEKGIELNKVLVRHEPDNEEYLVEMQPDGQTHHLTFWPHQSLPTQTKTSLVTHLRFSCPSVSFG